MFDFFEEFILEVIGYNVGYFFLKIFTVGKYPKEYKTDNDDYRIEYFGIFMLIIVLIVVSYIFV